MRILITFVVLLSLSSCNNRKQQTIQFKPISESEFNFAADTSFALPHGKLWDERKRVHDSCMGSSYAANAIFMRTRDTFFVGTIVNMKTMKIIKRPERPNDSLPHLPSILNVETRPCYEKSSMHVPIDSFMNHRFLFKIDSSNEKINHELIDAVRNSGRTEIETGSWINMELTDALGKILDTTTNQNLLEYKKALLTPGNVILVRSSAITEMSFYFHLSSTLPADLAKKLQEKPVSTEQPFFKAQFFYIDNNTFRLKLNGFFQVTGQFMKCELED